MVELLIILFFVAILGSAIFLHITDDSEVPDNPDNTKLDRRRARAKPVIIGLASWLLLIALQIAIMGEFNGAIAVILLLVCIIGALV